MKRTLTLSRESLTELTCYELNAVAGGGYTTPQCQIDMTRLLVETLITKLPEVTRTCTL